MASIRGPRKESDPTSSNTLKWHTALRSNIPDLKHIDAKRYNGHRVCPAPLQHDSMMKKLPRTIMAVSMGEADKRRDPLGDQAMEVTGE